MKLKLSRELKNEIRQKREAGTPLRILADEYGVTVKYLIGQRFPRSDSTFTCSCGQVIKPAGYSSHLRGTFHNHPAMRVMMGEPCVNMSDIASSYGVSRQMVNWLSKKVDQIPAKSERSLVCKKRKVSDSHVYLTEELRRQGLSWEPMLKGSRPLKNEILVGKYTCLIRKASPRKVYFSFGGSSKPHDFLFVRLSDRRDWLIIPKSEEPGRQTMCKIGDLQVSGAHSRKHYNQYLNNWNLLRGYV